MQASNISGWFVTILVHHLHSPDYIKNTAVATIKNIAVFATGVTLLAELDSEVPIVVERFGVVTLSTPPVIRFSICR